MFQKPRIAYFGNSDFSLIVLTELKKQGVIPDLIVTTPDQPVGRKQVLTPTQTKVWAEENSVPYIEQEKLKDETFLEMMKGYELFIVASYGKIIPKVLVDMPKYKVLNVHPSLLPKYRGPSPLQAQILAGDTEVGTTIMLIDEQVDHGAIVAQEKLILAEPVGFHEISLKLGTLGAKMLAQILPAWIDGNITPQEQEHEKATFTKKVEKIDGLIDLSADAQKNWLTYLAYEAWPGVYFITNRRGQDIRVIIKKAEYSNGEFKPARVLPEGKKEMDYADFLRGL